MVDQSLIFLIDATYGPNLMGYRLCEWKLMPVYQVLYMRGISVEEKNNPRIPYNLYREVTLRLFNIPTIIYEYCTRKLSGTTAKYNILNKFPVNAIFTFLLRVYFMSFFHCVFIRSILYFSNIFDFYH